jgi:hypothetical protein
VRWPSFQPVARSGAVFSFSEGSLLSVSRLKMPLLKAGVPLVGAVERAELGFDTWAGFVCGVVGFAVGFREPHGFYRSRVRS